MTTTPLQLAGIFHDTTQRLAPAFNHEPLPGNFQPASDQGQLIIAVCKEVLVKLDCNHSETTVILADVSPDRRMEIGRLAGVDYSLGPGSGQKIPLTLCLKCGRVQYMSQPRLQGCQCCGSTRPFYHVHSYNDNLGFIEVCLDCGQIQGNWPYRDFNQAEGRLHRPPVTEPDNTAAFEARTDER